MHRVEQDQEEESDAPPAKRLKQSSFLEWGFATKAEEGMRIAATRLPLASWAINGLFLMSDVLCTKNGKVVEVELTEERNALMRAKDLCCPVVYNLGQDGGCDHAGYRAVPRSCFVRLCEQMYNDLDTDDTPDDLHLETGDVMDMLTDGLRHHELEVTVPI